MNFDSPDVSQLTSIVELNVLLARSQGIDRGLFKVVTNGPVTHFKNTAGIDVISFQQLKQTGVQDDIVYLVEHDGSDEDWSYQSCMKDLNVFKNKKAFIALSNAYEDDDALDYLAQLNVCAVYLDAMFQKYCPQKFSDDSNLEKITVREIYKLHIDLRKLPSKGTSFNAHKIHYLQFDTLCDPRCFEYFKKLILKCPEQCMTGPYDFNINPGSSLQGIRKSAVQLKNKPGPSFPGLPFEPRPSEMPVDFAITDAFYPNLKFLAMYSYVSKMQNVKIHGVADVMGIEIKFVPAGIFDTGCAKPMRPIIDNVLFRDARFAQFTFYGQFPKVTNFQAPQLENFRLEIVPIEGLDMWEGFDYQRDFAPWKHLVRDVITLENKFSQLRGPA